MNSCFDAAVAAADAGISVWPPRQDGTKAPQGSWQAGQSRRADDRELERWYDEGLTGVGWVAGRVSGNLEVLDFDDRSVWAEFQRYAREAGLGELLDRMIAGYLEHSPNGAHLPYRCETIEGNQKLAMRKLPGGNGWKSIIETRGEGGYIIVAPSHGSVNVSGAYKLQSGSIETIPTITPAERAGLFMVARVFDESIVPKDDRKPLRTGAGERPGDAFNERATWAEVLEPWGWVRVGGQGGVTRWRRPGKEQGISATTGHAGTDFLYVFSTSTVFEANRGYSKFSAYALLNHGADFAEASRTLSLQGYGLELPQRDPEVDIAPLLANLFGSEAKPPALGSLMKVPGAVGELAEWIEAGARRSQPLLAMAASIAAVSTLIGRKVETETGMRPNVYVLGIGETGCGKERGREAIGKLFETLGVDGVLGDSFASGASIETAMIDRGPVRLFLIDEIGHLLGTIRDGGSDAHIKDIVPVLLRMYSASSSAYRRREYAGKDTENTSVLQPSLSIYGTTVPSNLYGNLTKAHVQNGLLSRLLVFESSDPYPHLRTGIVPGPPQSLLDLCKQWVSAPLNQDASAGDIERLTKPAPLTVTSTARARQVFEDLEASMRRCVERVRGAGGEQGPYTRVVATALKLALIRACGVSAAEPEITEDDAAWGAGMAWRLTEDLAAKVGDAAPENKTEDIMQRIVKHVRKAGSISRSELLGKLPSLTSRALDEHVKTLLEAGKLDMEQQATGGRPKTLYRVAV